MEEKNTLTYNVISHSNLNDSGVHRTIRSYILKLPVLGINPYESSEPPLRTETDFDYYQPCGHDSPTKTTSTYLLEVVQRTD